MRYTYVETGLRCGFLSLSRVSPQYAAVAVEFSRHSAFAQYRTRIDIAGELSKRPGLSADTKNPSAFPPNDPSQDLGNTEREREREISRFWISSDLRFKAFCSLSRLHRNPRKIAQSSQCRDLRHDELWFGVVKISIKKVLLQFNN